MAFLDLGPTRLGPAFIFTNYWEGRHPQHVAGHLFLEETNRRIYLNSIDIKGTPVQELQSRHHVCTQKAPPARGKDSIESHTTVSNRMPGGHSDACGKWGKASDERRGGKRSRGRETPEQGKRKRGH